jgi:hypothetical protein
MCHDLINVTIQKQFMSPISSLWVRVLDGIVFFSFFALPFLDLRAISGAVSACGFLGWGYAWGRAFACLGGRSCFLGRLRGLRLTHWSAQTVQRIVRFPWAVVIWYAMLSLLFGVGLKFWRHIAKLSCDLDRLMFVFDEACFGQSGSIEYRLGVNSCLTVGWLRKCCCHRPSSRVLLNPKNVETVILHSRKPHGSNKLARTYITNISKHKAN